jgi:hypothetical protein
MSDLEDYVQCGQDLAKLVPTSELRWEWKYVPAPHLGTNISQAEKVLHQKWVASAKMSDGGMWEEHRWREVPTIPPQK